MIKTVYQIKILTIYQKRGTHKIYAYYRTVYKQQNRLKKCKDVQRCLQSPDLISKGYKEYKRINVTY